MGKIEDLAKAYERQVATPWQETVSGSQRVMILVYDKELERSLRVRIGEFEQATRRSGHDWKLVDCTAWFAEWMARDKPVTALFVDPLPITGCEWAYEQWEVNFIIDQIGLMYSLIETSRD